MDKEQAGYIRQCAEGDRLWETLVNGAFNPVFIAMWNPSSIKKVLADDYGIRISDEDGKDLYLALAPMIADIMDDASNRAEERMIEVLAEFVKKVDGCPPE